MNTYKDSQHTHPIKHGEAGPCVTLSFLFIPALFRLDLTDLSVPVGISAHYHTVREKNENANMELFVQAAS